jgi:hypothetical protein
MGEGSWWKDGPNFVLCTQFFVFHPLQWEDTARELWRDEGSQLWTSSLRTMRLTTVYEWLCLLMPAQVYSAGNTGCLDSQVFSGQENLSHKPQETNAPGTHQVFLITLTVPHELAGAHCALPHPRSGSPSAPALTVICHLSAVSFPTPSPTWCGCLIRLLMTESLPCDKSDPFSYNRWGTMNPTIPDPPRLEDKGMGHLLSVTWGSLTLWPFRLCPQRAADAGVGRTMASPGLALHSHLSGQGTSLLFCSLHA